MPRAPAATKTPKEIEKNRIEKEITKAVKAIKDVQFKLKHEIKYESGVEIYKARNAAMKRRATHIAKIPRFWLTALKNSSEIGTIFIVDDKFTNESVDTKNHVPSPLHYFNNLKLVFSENQR